jgi:hypothetical protein
MEYNIFVCNLSSAHNFVNKYGQPKSLSLVAVALFGTHKSIFLVDVLGSSSKITKKLDFQPFRIEIHYGHIQNQD